jgi:hypothetical protein
LPPLNGTSFILKFHKSNFLPIFNRFYWYSRFSLNRCRPIFYFDLIFQSLIDPIVNLIDATKRQWLLLFTMTTSTWLASSKGQPVLRAQQASRSKASPRRRQVLPNVRRHRNLFGFMAERRGGGMRTLFVGGPYIWFLALSLLVTGVLQYTTWERLIRDAPTQRTETCRSRVSVAASRITESSVTLGRACLRLVYMGDTERQSASLIWFLAGAPMPLIRDAH